MSTNVWEANEEIQFFREYLRIPSVHPNPDYGGYMDYTNRIYENVFLIPLQSRVWSF